MRADRGGGQTAELDLRAPTSDQGLLAVFRRRYLLRLLVRREIQVRYSGSFLGMLWSYLNPLSQFFIYWFVMGIIIQRPIENIALHIFAALIMVYLFTETFNAGTKSIVQNRQLVQRMPMPREMFPVASMLVSLVHVGPQLMILIFFCILYGWVPEPGGIAAAFLAMGIVIPLGTALALVFSVANVFFRDVSSVVGILTNFVRFSVPMIYPFTMVEERFRGHTELYLLNPMAEAVLLMQRAFWVGSTDDPVATAAVELPGDLAVRGLVMCAVSLTILAIAQLIFSRLDNRIPERLAS